jgi:hypothetical protein
MQVRFHIDPDIQTAATQETTMMKDPNQYPGGWNAAKVRRIIRYYENQTEEEAAAEIEKAPEVESTTWVQVPTDLVPKVEKLLARHTKSA